MSYPKWKYHSSQSARIVHTEAEELALGEGWEESPAAFEMAAQADMHQHPEHAEPEVHPEPEAEHSAPVEHAAEPKKRGRPKKAE